MEAGIGRERERERGSRQEGLVKTTVWFRPDQRVALKVIAARREMGPSEVLREILDEFLKKHAQQ